jgi:putative membrane protein
MLMLTARWSDRLAVDNFWSALWASLIISLITSVLNRNLKNK